MKITINNVTRFAVTMTAEKIKKAGHSADNEV
jgi:hypothetical protein